MLRNRLSRMSSRGWDRKLSTLSTLLVGAVLAGSFGLIPFLGTPETSTQEFAYFGLLGVALGLAITFGLCAMAIEGERDDSVEAIRQDLDTLLAPYEGTSK